MTAKRLFGVVKGHREHIVDHTGRLYSDSEVADLLNTVYENCNMYREDALKAEKDKEELFEENEQLKQSNEDARHILKREFDFATEQRQKHLDDPVVTNAYDIIRFDMRKALDKLGWLE